MFLAEYLVKAIIEDFRDVVRELRRDTRQGVIELLVQVRRNGQEEDEDIG